MSGIHSAKWKPRTLQGMNGARRQQFLSASIDPTKLSAVEAKQVLYASAVHARELRKSEIAIQTAKQKCTKAAAMEMKKRADQAKELKMPAAELAFRNYQADYMLEFKAASDAIKAAQTQLAVEEKAVEDAQKAEVDAGGVLGSAQQAEQAKSVLLTGVLVAMSAGLVYGGWKCSAPVSA
jgi:hypothetical protein